MDNCDEARAMWHAYVSTLPDGVEPAATYITWHFASSEEVANALGALAQAGIKTATAGLLWDYEANEEELPKPGETSIITDWHGRPLCIVETSDVKVTPFNQVDADHAYAEGEGDRSLAYWREVHWRIFSATCAQIGREPAEDMPVVCERFRKVYPPAGAA